MNLFFDTSALVKFFYEEQGSEIVTDLITDPENIVYVSDLARLEFISVLYPPDKTAKAVDVVMEQTKLMCQNEVNSKI
ncbi:MAG: PIN domain-containing protein [Bacillota bacterium]